jgi:hypothetical protein
VTAHTTNVVFADTTRRCICRDPAYVDAYQTKYGTPRSGTKKFTTVLHRRGRN